MGEIKFIDANIFLELMLDDINADKCKNLFYQLKNTEIEAKTSDFIIYTCLLQIQNKLKSVDAMMKFILFLNEIKGLMIMKPSISEIYNSLILAKKYKLNFDDSLVVSIMLRYNMKKLISFDKHFDKVKIINREEP